ncbi:CP family cyanate transporter-like MFS transporter [Nocardiopsis arvandica]|uniref:CP family cyanate transporter-like MFS transporter n=1 Tax=Nocardiopsis sinuspersici TaxID=501010 RepID=A0A7Z0BLV6_9ACTN|nr:MFS transporter [Nocardiopsis sinuspersici]NYH54630.1 CP family cyanate transporter-like MFS transporter [Nocardiopsis sinuspersici]
MSVGPAPSTPVSSGSSAGRAVRPPRVVLLLIAAGIALAALNLRTAITSVGPVLDEVTSGLGMTAVGAGVLTTLPVLCFALFGGLTPLLARRLGEHHLLVGALTALTAGLAARAVAPEPWVFLALSAVALSGGAVGNVILPALVKQHFPERVGLMTTVYTTALALGTTIAAAATVPLEQSTGEWRVALGAYALFGVVAAVPWLLVLRHEPGRGDPAHALGFRQVLSTGLGWQSLLYFGTQSSIAYIMFGWYAQMLRDQGMDAQTAGLALSYLTVLGIPMSLLLPTLLTRMGDQRPFVVVFAAAYTAGLTGLWIAPLSGVWVWTTLVGIGMGTFVFALTSFALRTRTGAGTAALSASSQSLGYLMGGAGPFLFGLLHESSGGWHAPLLLVASLVAVNLAVGMLLGRPRYLEDVLAARGLTREASPDGR